MEICGFTTTFGLNHITHIFKDYTMTQKKECAQKCI